jgi:hypothetical protein
MSFWNTDLDDRIMMIITISSYHDITDIRKRDCDKYQQIFFTQKSN